MRLRPAWEDLRCYLTAKGRKRFEVYVCTMAERDYALEMWRLLDPEAHLIGSKQILDRVICVKSGIVPVIIKVFVPSLMYVTFKHYKVFHIILKWNFIINIIKILSIDFSMGSCWFCNSYKLNTSLLF